MARRFLIRGRVQGVGFRYFVQEAAAVENAGGWVRNLADGRVEAFVVGDRESLDRVERRVRRGPPGARVDDVDVFDEEAMDRPPRFVIRHDYE